MNKKLEQELEPDKSNDNVLKEHGNYDEILKMTLLNLRKCRIQPFKEITEFITADLYVVDYDTYIIIDEVSAFLKEHLKHYLEKNKLKDSDFVNLYNRLVHKNTLINVIHDNNLKLIVLDRYNMHKIESILLKRLKNGHDKKR